MSDALHPTPTIVATVDDPCGVTAVPDEIDQLVAEARRQPPPLARLEDPGDASFFRRADSLTLPEEVSQGPAPRPLTTLPWAAHPPAPLEPDRRLGDYRLDELLGEGATAAVWRATDMRLHMPIALKLFDPRGRGGDAVLQAVMREARAASRVVSDYIIRVKDAGHFEELGLGFIAMELCAALPDGRDIPDDGSSGLVVGKALDQRLPRTTADAIRIVAQATRGVADAHREGVFHRDVKPANILVRPGGGRAQITDFGLTVAELGASSLGIEGSVRIPVARPSRKVIIGTPDYMAPEAAHGLPAGLDPVRDHRLLVGLDVYGLGATLYAVLAGRPPFRDNVREQVTVAELLERVKTREPPALHELERPRLPVTRQISRVVARAMARDPEERYASARELADDLEAILEHRPTSLDLQDRPLRARLYLRRNRLRVNAAASVAVMVVALAATAVTGWRLESQVREAEARITQLDAQRQHFAAEAGQWEAAASDAEQRVEDALVRESQAREVIALTEGNLDAARKRAWQLLQEREAARASAVEQTERAVQAEDERDRARATATDWEHHANNLGRERDLARGEASEWKSRASELEGERDAVRTDLQTAQAQLAKTTAELKDERELRWAAEDKAVDLAARLRKAERERDAARSQLEDLAKAQPPQVHAEPPVALPGAP